jgi:GT2 family glycosyltransferase
MIDLSIIIVSYNTKDFLEKCLTSVFANTLDAYSIEVIVVDNDSHDDSTAMVKSHFPKVFLIENKENLGFSKANNIGIKKAKGRYILFLNSDTEVSKDTFATMIAFMDEYPDAGASTCKLVMSNGKLDDGSHRGFPTPWNAFAYFSGLAKLFPSSMLFNGYNLAWKDLEKIHTIDALVGAFMLVRREAGEQANWWDEEYFFYGEDLDFCYVLKQKGWKIYYVPTTEVLHYKGVSGGIKNVSKELTTASLETKKRATLARFNAMKIFYKKHYKQKYPSFLTWLVMKGIDIKLWATLRKYT